MSVPGGKTCTTEEGVGGNTGMLSDSTAGMFDMVLGWINCRRYMGAPPSSIRTSGGKIRVTDVLRNGHSLTFRHARAQPLSAPPERRKRTRLFTAASWKRDTSARALKTLASNLASALSLAPLHQCTTCGG